MLNGLEALVIARANETYVYDSQLAAQMEKSSEQLRLKSESGKENLILSFMCRTSTQSSVAPQQLRLTTQLPPNRRVHTHHV